MQRLRLRRLIQTTMGDNDTVRQRIINSVFDRRNAAGQRENYVAHLKIWEDAEDGTQKPRFILLARMFIALVPCL